MNRSVQRPASSVQRPASSVQRPASSVQRLRMALVVGSIASATGLAVACPPASYPYLLTYCDLYSDQGDPECFPWYGCTFRDKREVDLRFQLVRVRTIDGQQVVEPAQCLCYHPSGQVMTVANLGYTAHSECCNSDFNFEFTDPCTQQSNDLCDGNGVQCLTGGSITQAFSGSCALDSTANAYLYGNSSTSAFGGTGGGIYTYSDQVLLVLKDPGPGLSFYFPETTAISQAKYTLDSRNYTECTPGDLRLDITLAYDVVQASHDVHGVAEPDAPFLCPTTLTVVVVRAGQDGGDPAIGGLLAVAGTDQIGTGLFAGSTGMGTAAASVTNPAGTYAFSTATHTFRVPGDVDGDGKVCYADVIAVQLALGSHTGDTTFNPRADVNLDGVIDAGDVELIRYFGNIAGCFADFNCDGILNPDDLGDFITAYFANSPTADFNLDGVLNPDDIGDYVTAYFTGCP